MVESATGTGPKNSDTLFLLDNSLDLGLDDIFDVVDEYSSAVKYIFYIFHCDR